MYNVRNLMDKSHSGYISTQIQTVDTAAMTDVKRRKLPHCEDIIACSSIITYSSRSPNTSDKQIRVNVGLSQCPHDRQGRPKTALGKLQASVSSQKPRPATAFGSAYTKKGIASVTLNNVNILNEPLILSRSTY